MTIELPAGVDQPQIPTTHEQTTTTLNMVGLHVDCDPSGTQTLVITKLPSGDTIRVPMDFAYAAQFRKDWDTRLATIRDNGHNIDSDPED